MILTINDQPKVKYSMNNYLSFIKVISPTMKTPGPYSIPVNIIKKK